MKNNIILNLELDHVESKYILQIPLVLSRKQSKWKKRPEEFDRRHSVWDPPSTPLIKPIREKKKDIHYLDTCLVHLNFLNFAVIDVEITAQTLHPSNSHQKSLSLEGFPWSDESNI